VLVDPAHGRDTGFWQGFDTVLAGPPMLFFQEPFADLDVAAVAIRSRWVRPDTALRWLDRATFATGLASRANALTDRALGWIVGREPFFQWIDYTDPYDPFDPPEPHRSRFADGVEPLRGFVGGAFERDRRRGPGHALRDRLPQLGPEERQDLVDLYDAEIASLDAQIGRMVETLRQKGRLDDTVVVVVGDRGGLMAEVDAPPPERIRVPLLIRYPARLPSGRRVGARAAVEDLLPTVLDLTGTPLPEATDGESLVERIQSTR
jgi:arylsulfatase A-like enzyme